VRGTRGRFESVEAVSAQAEPEHCVGHGELALRQPPGARRELEWQRAEDMRTGLRTQPEHRARKASRTRQQQDRARLRGKSALPDESVVLGMCGEKSLKVAGTDGMHRQAGLTWFGDAVEVAVERQSQLLRFGASEALTLVAPLQPVGCRFHVPMPISAPHVPHPSKPA